MSFIAEIYAKSILNSGKSLFTVVSCYIRVELYRKILYIHEMSPLRISSQPYCTGYLVAYLYRLCHMIHEPSMTSWKWFNWRICREWQLCCRMFNDGLAYYEVCSKLDTKNGHERRYISLVLQWPTQWTHENQNILNELLQSICA